MGYVEGLEQLKAKHEKRSKTTNFDPEKAAEQRKAEMKDITEKLEKGVQEVFGSEQFQNLLDTMAKFPHYSVNNNIIYRCTY